MLSCDGGSAAGIYVDAESGDRLGWLLSGGDQVMTLNNQSPSFNAPSIFDMSADGSLVAGRAWRGGFADPAFWTPGSSEPVLISDFFRRQGVMLPQGYGLVDVTGISDDGRFWTGLLLDSDFERVPFVVQLPAPSSGVALLGVAGLSLLRRRR